MEREYKIVFDAANARQAALDINALAAAVGALAAAQQAFNQSAPQAQQNLQGMHVPAQQGAQAVQGLGTAMLAMQAGAVVVREAREALDAYGEAAKRAHKEEMGAARKGLDQREQAREYANLMNKSDPDDEVMSRLFSLSTGAGMGFREALQFGEQYLGAIPAGRQRGHTTPEIERRLEMEGALFSRRIGLDAAGGGKMAGVMAEFMDLAHDDKGGALSPEEAMRKAGGSMNAIAYGLNEGIGKVSRLLSAEFASAIPMIASGRLTSDDPLGEGAAFVGVGSLFAGRESSAGTRFKQLDRLLNHVGGDAGKFLQEAGVADARGDRAKLAALRDYLQKQGVTDIQSYLAEKGFGNAEERASAAGYIENFGVLTHRLDEGRRRAANGQEALDANRQFLASMTGQYGVAKAQEEAGVNVRGRGEQRLDIARTAARGRIAARDESLTPTWGDRLENKFDPELWSGKTDATQRRIDREVFRDLERRAESAGINLAERFPQWVRKVDHGPNQSGLFTTEAGRDPNSLAQMIEALNPELTKKGLGFGGENAAQADQVMTKFAQAVDKFAEAADRAGGRPGGGGGPRAGDGGIGGPKFPHRGGG